MPCGRAAFERRPALVRAFAIAVAAQLVLLPLLIGVGVDTLERSAAAGGPALLPVAQLAGGLIFGAGISQTDTSTTVLGRRDAPPFRALARRRAAHAHSQRSP